MAISLMALWLKWSDTIGAWLSGGCAVHCALWPIIAATAPALIWEQYDVQLWTAAILISMVSMIWGWRAHRNAGPIVCAAVAWMWALAMWMLGASHEMLWVTGLLLMGSHLWNRHRHKKICGISSTHACSAKRSHLMK